MNVKIFTVWNFQSASSTLCVIFFSSFTFFFLVPSYFLRLLFFVFIVKNYLSDWYMNVCNKKSLRSTSFQYELVLETPYCIWDHCDGSLRCPFTYLHFYDGEWRGSHGCRNVVFRICPKQEQTGQIFVWLILSQDKSGLLCTARWGCSRPAE
jgi:hypothetical protein